MGWVRAAGEGEERRAALQTATVCITATWSVVHPLTAPSHRIADDLRCAS